MSKLSESKQTKVVLITVLNNIIKLLHPFMPFVTEEIFQKLPNEEISIMISDWPEDNGISFPETEDKEWFFELIKRIRTIRNDYQVSWSKPIDMYIQANDSDKLFLETNEKYFMKFLNPNKFEIKPEITNVENAVTVILANIQVYIPLGSLVNLDDEVDKLQSEKAKLEQEIDRCNKMLNNSNFINKAPQSKIDEEKFKLSKYEDNLKETINRLNELKG